LGAIGIPFYVCASASVPIAMVLLNHGFSVGAVVVFLFAGPATNVATIMTVNKVYGKHSGLKLAGVALFSAVVMGFAINFFYDPTSLDVLRLADHEHAIYWFDYINLTLLAVLALASLYRLGPLHWLSEVASMVPGAIHHPPVEESGNHGNHGAE
jgi:hypothetical protein